MVLNSVIVASVTVADRGALCVAGGLFLFAVPGEGRKFLFFLILSTQFIPAVVIVLPFFLMFRNWTFWTRGSR